MNAVRSNENAQRNAAGTADFLIRIHFRQHASWQGEIQWLGGQEGRTLFFRSLLEMILLINEAMELGGSVDKSCQPHSWSRNSEDSVS